ncbi:MAG: SAM-dependent chlorinase/fluorinase [Armatimonadetes bacterium]|nr:SAM-dependent chlorinase/fluorinase [Armatimonadota bacterium]
MSTAPIVALLSDFGLRDPYVGAIKGVLLSRCPQAVLVDITHEIDPGDVFGGALALLAAAPYFPEQTIFLAVVDPGVGGPRRPICVRAGGRHFVGPDNGLLWLAAAACGPPEAYALTEPAYRLPTVSDTFHGRDLFAPAAAALATGVPAERLGPRIRRPTRLTFPSPAVRPGEARGEVLLIDRFGNAITNLCPAHLGCPAPGEVIFAVEGAQIRGPSRSYQEAAEGDLVVVLGSTGRYEIAINRGSAAERLHLRRGSPVHARRSVP